MLNVPDAHSASSSQPAALCSPISVGVLGLQGMAFIRTQVISLSKQVLLLAEPPPCSVSVFLWCLGIKPKVCCMLDTCSTTKLYLDPIIGTYFCVPKQDPSESSALGRQVSYH